MLNEMSQRDILHAMIAAQRVRKTLWVLVRGTWWIVDKDNKLNDKLTTIYATGDDGEESTIRVADIEDFKFMNESLQTDPFDFFTHQLVLDEAKSKLTATIEGLTKSGRKYVSYETLKKEMNLDDDSFNEVIKGAQKANRHSNKYVFAEVDDQPHVGIAASKRKGKSVPTSDPGHGIAHRPPSKRTVMDMQSKKMNTQDELQGPGPLPAAWTKAYEHREREVWGIYNRHGWRGLDRLGILPEGWQKMSGEQLIESIVRKEFVNEGWTQDKISKLQDSLSMTYPYLKIKKGDLEYIITDADRRGVVTINTSDRNDEVRFEYSELPDVLFDTGGKKYRANESVNERSEEEILRDLKRRYQDLDSPEYIYADGERSRSQAQALIRRLKDEILSLIKELGREPTDKEIWS